MLIVLLLLGLLALALLYEQIARYLDRRTPLPGRLIQAGPYRLHLREFGQGARPIIIIHGAGDSSFTWLRAAEALGAHGRVYLYDRSGMGASPDGPPVTAERCVDELDQLTRALGITQPAILVGHSMGGLIARLYGAKYPERVAGFVLVDSVHEAMMDDPTFQKSIARDIRLLKTQPVIAQMGIYRLFTPAIFGLFSPEVRQMLPQLSRTEERQWRASVVRGALGANPAEWVALPSVVAAGKAALAEGNALAGTPVAVLGAPAFGERWMEWQRELAARSSVSTFETKPAWRHCIQMMDAAAIARAAGWVGAQVDRQSA